MKRQPLYDSLLDALKPLPDDPGRIALLRALQVWLARHLGEFSDQARLDYGLDRYALLDLSQYPVERSDLEADVELRQLRARRAERDELAMRARDLFWEGTTLRSGVDCPVCHADELRVLMNDDELILSCDMCSWSQRLDGTQWQGPGKLRTPTTSQLEPWFKTHP